MRCKDGGGTRVIEVDADSGRFDIISLAKRLFFPGGRNCICSEDDVLFDLASFSREKIEATVLFPDGSTKPFTVENYLQSAKLSKIRLYLMTTYMEDLSDDDKVHILRSNNCLKLVFRQKKETFITRNKKKKWKHILGKMDVCSIFIIFLVFH